MSSAQRRLQARHVTHVSSVAVEDLSAKDAIIAVVGATGTGKSSFIGQVTGGEVTIGHDLQPCTTDIQIIKLLYPERPDLDLVFVDTPGLDMEEEKVVFWLKEIYKRGIRPAGVLYLHRITDNHLTMTAFRILRMFKAFCESIALRNIILMTTMWDDVEEEAGLQRQKELEMTHWKGMIDWGCQTGLYRNSLESAWDMLDLCLRNASNQLPLPHPPPPLTNGVHVLSNRPAKNAEIRSFGKMTPGSKELRAMYSACVSSVAVEDITAEDVIIAVTGPTGAGKSSFIRLATGGEAAIGHDLEPCTKEIQIFKLHYPERPDLDIVFIDTPGLDIGYEKIVDWLRAISQHGIKPAGLLYLHRITDNHLEMTTFGILRMFKAFWESIGLRNITLITTMWDEVDKDLGSQRQTELEKAHWRAMIDWGCKVSQYRNSSDSAWDILEYCLRTDHASLVKKSGSPAVSAWSPLTSGIRDFWSSLIARLVKVEDMSNQDIIIIVIGPTGAGKSTFINTAVGHGELRVGHGLTSCTEEVQAVRCTYPGSEGGRDLVFVDTPAFNHDAKNETEVARTIKKWLTKSYARKNKVAGIIYIHRISDVRMTERPLANLMTFQDMCGSDNFPEKILLVTTMWSLVDEATGLHREDELRAVYWSSMIACGSGMIRFKDNAESAWEAVRLLLQGQGSNGVGQKIGTGCLMTK